MMDDPVREMFRKLDAANADTRLRRYSKLARRTGLLECFEAGWRTRGCFQERIRVRAERYADHCEITCEILQRQESVEWEPDQVRRRSIDQLEWKSIVERAVAANFWEQPTRAASNCLDGEEWKIEGFADGRFHVVARNTTSISDGTGVGMFELGNQLARVAGLKYREGWHFL